MAHDKTPDMQLANEKRVTRERCMWAIYKISLTIYKIGTKWKKEPEEYKYDHYYMTDIITSF